jgi:hypothetical protein
MTDNTDSLLQEIYDNVYNLELCQSRYEFSENIAGRSKRWMSTIISQKTDPSAVSLIVIRNNIMSVARATKRNKTISSAKQICSKIDRVVFDRIMTDESI